MGAEAFAGGERPQVQQSDEHSLLKRAKYSHNRFMKRNSKKRFHGTIAKRRTMPKVSLSNLPMDILSQILSWLPINDAIRTSVLSREWKCIWQGHTKLTFNSATLRRHYSKSSVGYGFINDEEFIARVDTVLCHHSGAEIEHMEVKHRLDNKHANHIDRWINFAITSKTKELIIDLSGGFKLSLSRDMSRGIHKISEEPYSLPSQLLSADNVLYLQRLELTSLSLQLPTDFKGFLNLRNLTLVDVSITDKDVQYMLLRCNHLEFFEVAYCRMITSIQIPHPSNQLKYLVVDECPLLQVIELNCSPTMLKYTGPTAPLILGSTSKLKNICINFMFCNAILDYMVTGFPSTLPSLKTLTLNCGQWKRIILPGNPFIFTHLRHLKLELILYGKKKRKTDVLDYAYLLEVAPFIEKLELLMWLRCPRRPYREEHGELRIRSPHQHTHLKSVHFSGFFGHKDQVELALHILRSSIILEKMEISPRVEIGDCCGSDEKHYEREEYADGHRIATEFVCKADQRNVVNAVKASFSWGPPLDRGYTGGVHKTSRPGGRLSRMHKCRRVKPPKTRTK